MSTLRDIRNAVSMSMAADGINLQDILEYRADFKESVRISDDKSLLYSRKERVEVVTRLPLRKH